jgi:hypothetical protein
MFTWFKRVRGRTPVSATVETIEGRNAKYRIVAKSERPAGQWGQSQIRIFVLQGSKATSIGNYTRNYHFRCRNLLTFQ